MSNDIELENEAIKTRIKLTAQEAFEMKRKGKEQMVDT